MATSRKSAEPNRPRRPAAKTIEARERQLVALAFDVAEQQMLDGTASAQVITHYLKLGTPRERLERKKLEEENALLRAKVEGMASAARVEELYEGAIRAMRAYSGQDLGDDDGEI
jgi:hypothetical protein